MNHLIRHIYCSIKPEHLKLKPVEGREGFYTVDTPFYVDMQINNEWVIIKIPNGFLTDLMSGPRKLKERLGIGELDHVIASIVHDYLYAFRLVHTDEKQTFSCTRKDADQVMRDLMYHFDECDDFVIDAVYDFLRGFCWLPWYIHRLKGLFMIEGHVL